MLRLLSGRGVGTAFFVMNSGVHGRPSIFHVMMRHKRHVNGRAFGRVHKFRCLSSGCLTGASGTGRVVGASLFHPPRKRVH